MELLKDCLITRVKSAVAAGQTAQTSSVLDMSGYDGVIFICSLGTVTDASVLTLTAYGNTANSTSSPTPVSIKATTAATASTSSNTDLVVDVIRPGYQYVFVTLTRTTQDAVLNGITAIQYRARSVPVTQGSSVLASAISTPAA